MSAHKLADDLQECIDDGSTDLVCVQEAAILIRQQAERIAELQKRLERYQMALKHYKNKADYLDKRELELLAMLRGDK